MVSGGPRDVDREIMLLWYMRPRGMDLSCTLLLVEVRYVEYNNMLFNTSDIPRTRCEELLITKILRKSHELPCAFGSMLGFERVGESPGFDSRHWPV